MQHNAYMYIIHYMLYVGLIQKYHNTLDLWLTELSCQANWKQCLELQNFEGKTKSITVFLNRAYWIFWKIITLLNVWKQHHYRDIGSVRKNSTIGVIYNWYVLLYLNIVLKVCKNGYTCNQLQSGKILTKSFFYGIDTGGTVRIINCPRGNCVCKTWHWIRENKSNNKDGENIAKKSCVLSNFIPWKCH